MKILFDLNVLIDVACRWREFPDSKKLYEYIAEHSEHQGAFAASGYTTLYYVIAQMLSEQRTRGVVQHFGQSLELIACDAELVRRAHMFQMSDLEDACIAATALQGSCDVIATRNDEDFANSPIRSASPTAILKEL